MALGRWKRPETLKREGNMLVTRVGKMEKEGIEEPGGSGSSGKAEEPRGQRGAGRK